MLMAHVPEDDPVCQCFNVPEERIRRAILEGGLRSVEEVTEATGAGGGCGSCWDEIREILEETGGTPPRAEAPPRAGNRPPDPRPEP